MNIFTEFRKKFTDSMDELKDTHTIAVCGIFTALSVALKFVASIDIGPYIRIGISDIPGIIISCLYGPAVGGIFWGALDIIKYLVAPNGPFFPGFTVSAILNGFIFGVILYRKSYSVQRIFAAELISKIIVSIGLNTLWLAMLYKNAFIVMLPARILTNLIMLPIDTAITFVFVRTYRNVFRLSAGRG